MEVSMNHIILMCIFAAASSIRLVSSSSSVCHPQSISFLNDLRFQCPPAISPSSPIEMDGDSLDRALGSSLKNVCTAVLFYSSWCPFSRGVRSKFNILSSMFPQIRHLAVEQSSAMPSVFSRYGIHSLPSILIMNQTANMPYYGRKDLHSLARFYKRTTGLDPVDDLTEDQPSSLGSGEKALQPWKGALQPWKGLSLNEILIKEPYLVFSVLFLCLRASLYFFPEILSRIMALWVSYVPHLNLGIFGESSQLLWRVLHLIDVKRVRNKLKLCKTRNFHKGAKSAQVWASSLASVSLGETSSMRSSPSGDS